MDEREIVQTLNQHQYIIAETESGSIAIVHDPDCPHDKKNYGTNTTTN
jgi:hypothetical protein